MESGKPGRSGELRAQGGEATQGPAFLNGESNGGWWVVVQQMEFSGSDAQLLHVGMANSVRSRPTSKRMTRGRCLCEAYVFTCQGVRYAGGGHLATQQEHSRWEGRVRQVESLGSQAEHPMSPWVFSPKTGCTSNLGKAKGGRFQKKEKKPIYRKWLCNTHLKSLLSPYFSIETST